MCLYSKIYMPVSQNIRACFTKYSCLFHKIFVPVSQNIRVRFIETTVNQKNKRVIWYPSWSDDPFMKWSVVSLYNLLYFSCLRPMLRISSLIRKSPSMPVSNISANCYRNRYIHLCKLLWRLKWGQKLSISLDRPPIWVLIIFCLNSFSYGYILSQPSDFVKHFFDYLILCPNTFYSSVLQLFLLSEFCNFKALIFSKNDEKAVHR